MWMINRHGNRRETVQRPRRGYGPFEQASRSWAIALLTITIGGLHGLQPRIGELDLRSPALALPAVLSTQDVGSRVNIRSGPTTSSAIVQQGITGDRVEVIRDVQGTDGFTWYFVVLESSGFEGWVRGDLLQLGTHEAPIREGNYWVGPTGMGLEVDSDQYRYYDELGPTSWEPISDLTYITDGVVFYGDDYWCLSSLPTPETTATSSGVVVCTADGWGWSGTI